MPPGLIARLAEIDGVVAVECLATLAASPRSSTPARGLRGPGGRRRLGARGLLRRCCGLGRRVANVARVTVSSCSVCAARDVSSRRASSTPALPCPGAWTACGPSSCSSSRRPWTSSGATAAPAGPRALTLTDAEQQEVEEAVAALARGSPGESEPGLLGGRLYTEGMPTRDHGRRGPDSRRLDARAQAPLREASRPTCASS